METDFSGSTVDGTAAESLNGTVGVPVTQSVRVEQDIDWLGTARVRLGYATGNWLPFATAGLAFGKVADSYSYSLPIPGTGNLTADAAESQTKTGWTVGGGAEYSFGSWSIKSEYLYYNLGDNDLSAELLLDGKSISTVTGTSNDVFLNPNFDVQGHIARIGLNFQLD